MPDDPVATTLAEIRGRAEGSMRKFRDVDASQRDVPPLLRVAEAALKLADDLSRKAEAMNAAADHAAAEDPGAPVVGLRLARSMTYNDCAAALRETIRAALTGEEAGNE